MSIIVTLLTAISSLLIFDKEQSGELSQDPSWQEILTSVCARMYIYIHSFDKGYQAESYEKGCLCIHLLERCDVILRSRNLIINND